MKIFISYRRSLDTATAWLIKKELSNRLKHVEFFQDISGIESGENFEVKIDQAVQQADLVIVIISPLWLNTINQNNQNRSNEFNRPSKDYVQYEIENSLNQNKRLIPILVEDTSMPKEHDLPPSIEPLSKVQSLRINFKDFTDSIKRLHSRCEKILKEEYEKKISDRFELQKNNIKLSEHHFFDPKIKIEASQFVPGKSLSIKYTLSWIESFKLLFIISLGCIILLIIGLIAFMGLLKEFFPKETDLFSIIFMFGLLTLLIITTIIGYNFALRSLRGPIEFRFKELKAYSMNIQFNNSGEHLSWTQFYLKTRKLKNFLAYISSRKKRNRWIAVLEFRPATKIKSTYCLCKSKPSGTEDEALHGISTIAYGLMNELGFSQFNIDAFRHTTED